jgi:glyoxylase-like metal-dependent hydrolase (beta-lactamase superfamily II)
MTRSRIFAVAGIVTVAAIALFVSGTTARKWIFSQAIPPAYFSHFDTIAPALYQVSGPVYAFEKGFTRSLVLRTPEGIAVFDSFNEKHAAALKDAVARQFPGEAIRWTIHSHNHLDHIRGSALLGPRK